MEIAHRRPPFALVAVTLGAAAAAGVAVAARPGLFELASEPGLADLLAAAAAGLAGVLLVVRPSLALAAIVVFVGLNLSEVLVRFHGQRQGEQAQQRGQAVEAD
ncbi:MAG: hypothetical protein F9K18_14180, partial [Thermoanaerobaculia bacterium]